LGERVKVKWPNDVLVGDKKISGVLCEYVAPAGAVVIGVGINLLQTQEQLPVELATSLRAEGVGDVSAESVLAGYLSNLRASYESLVAANFDAEASGLRAKVLAACATVGHPVRAILPADQEFAGVATDIDGTGRLVIRKDSDASLVSISAGDIVHLRHFDLSSERIVS
jgi:BirA family biotin operon repressor/biotin-[acetyl-CoA-carboxylase] ligase